MRRPKKSSEVHLGGDRQSDINFRALIENGPDIFLLLNEKLEVQYVSPNITTVMGYSIAEFVAMERWEVAHPDDREALGRSTARLLQHPSELIRAEVRLRHKNGEWKVFQQTARNLLHEPAVAAIHSTLTDITELKQAQTALLESEIRYQNLIEHASDAIFLSDAAGNYLDVNSSGCKMLGYSRDEILSLHMSELIAPADLSQRPLRVEDLKQSETLIRERRLQRKDGTLVPTEISGTKLPNGNILGIVRDISERQRTQEALNEQEKRFRLAMENIPDVVIIYGTDLRIQFINSATTVITGLKPEEYIGRRDDEIWPPAIYEQYLPALKESLLTCSVRSVDVILNQDTESERKLLVTCVPVLDDDGNVLEILGITQDLTERLQSEAALRQFNQRLSMLRQIDQGIVGARSVSQLAGTVIQHILAFIGCADAHMVLFDFEERRANVYTSDAENNWTVSQRSIGFDDYPLLPMLRQERIVYLPDLPVSAGEQDKIRSALNAGLWVRGELIGNLGLAAAEPDFFSEEHLEVAGEVANQLAMAITQLRLYEQLTELNAELEERVNDRTRQLASKNRELETFTYTVSHDLKAPLRGILGYSQLLAEDFASVLDETGRGYLDSIGRGVAQMNELIDDLLAYSRLERRSLQPVTIDLALLTQSLLEEQPFAALAKSVVIMVSVPAVHIQSDVDGLRLAMRNVIENAIKFSQHRPEPRIEIGGVELADTVQLWVRDNGVGFDMRYHDQILNIFQRLQPAEAYGGTGIGLAIVNKAMERLGGRVWAESEPDRGATFYLEIPKCN